LQSTVEIHNGIGIVNYFQKLIAVKFPGILPIDSANSSIDRVDVKVVELHELSLIHLNQLNCSFFGGELYHHHHHHHHHLESWYGCCERVER